MSRPKVTLYGWVLLGSMLATVVVVAPPRAIADTTTLEPVADTYVTSSAPSSHAGSAIRLWVDGSPKEHALLRFDVPDVGSPVIGATLQLYVTRSTTSLDARPVASTWTEATATWANAPAPGAVVASSGPLQRNAWATLAVTAIVTGPGPVSIAVTTNNSHAQAFDSREGAHPPRLLVEYGSAPPVSGTTYYVDSVRGSDSNAGTSPSTAWRTLGKLSAVTPAPGDRVLLARGSTWTGPLSLGASGTQQRPITVASYGTGALPVITGSSDCVTINGSYIDVSEINARDCSWAGIRISGGSNRVERTVITGNAAGIHVATGAVGNAIIDNDIVNNNRMSRLTASPTDDDSGAFGVLLNGDYTEVAHNRISGSDAFSYDYGRDGAAIEIYAAQHNSIHHNIATDNHAFSELGGSRSTANVFAFNVVRSTLDTSNFVVTRGGSTSSGPVTGTELYRNTVRLSGARSQGVVCYGGCSSAILKMRGNIVVGQYKTMYADAPFDEDYDLFAGGGTVNFTAGLHTIRSDPFFVNAVGGDLRIQATSPAIDRGTAAPFPTDADGQAAVQDGNGDGNAIPDIGAYERSAGTGPTTPTTTVAPTTTVRPTTTVAPSTTVAPTTVKPTTTTVAPTTTVKPTTTTSTTPPPPPPPTTAPPPPPPGSPMNVVAVGDIQPPSSSSNASATASAASGADFILGLGDYQYQTGTLANYNNYFDKSWGPLVPKMYPVLAPNHDNYWEGDPITYFNGGGAHGYKAPVTLQSLSATDRGYSFDRVVGTNKWHFIVIPDTCYRTSGCDTTLVGNWIASDMASHPNSIYPCTVAYWHAPFFASNSSQHNVDEPGMSAWVKTLSDNKVDLILQGHNHLYERFDPQDYTRTAKADGMRAFVVGTGGIGFYSFTSTAVNSVVRNADTYGVLKLTLRQNDYDWKFQPVSGGTFTDSGTGSCH